MTNAKRPATVLTRDALRVLAGDRAYERGEMYASEGRVHDIAEDRGHITATVMGSARYHASLWVEGKKVRYACSCPVGDDGACCKHCVALGLAWLERAAPTAGAAATGATALQKTAKKRSVGTRPLTMKDVHTHLAAERKDTLVELLMRHAMADEGLRQQLLLDTARSTRNGVNLDTFRQAISNAIESGEFVDYREAYSYFARVDDVITSIAELTDKHPQAVVELVEYALASMERSIGSVDDSDGGTSEILDRLHALHLAACERARPDPLALARTLFEWELRSEWEIFHGAVVRYAKVLGKKGLAAYRALAEAEWARVPVLRADAGDRNRHSSRYQITAIMESLATMSGDLEALVAVKQRDLSSAYAYLTIAQLYKSAGQQDRAMEWAEKGVKDFPQRASSELRTFLAAQYRRLKRHDEAMTLLWTVFADSPTLEHYAALHQYAEPIGKWPVWRERALATVREGIATRGDDAKRRPAYGDTRVDGSLLVRIFLWEKDVDAAWREAEATGCSASLWMQLARLRERTHPADAVRVYQEAVERALGQKHNDAYREAVDLLRDIARAMKRSKDSPGFAAYVEAVRARHKPKRNFVKLLDAARF